MTKNRSGASLIVIGGGNYWETWPTNSRTGTSLDITFDELDSLGLPVFFNALGVDVAQGVSDNSLKLPEFLQQCSLSNNFFVSVRNDGAAQNLRGTLGYDGDLAELPDHGFFALKRTGAPSSMRTAAVNLALDPGKHTVCIDVAGSSI